MDGLYDSHVHSCRSHDSEQTLKEICWAARARGLRGVSITDHADLWFLEKDDTFLQIATSTAEAKAADQEQNGGLRVFCGVELSEAMDDPENTARILALADYDVVLGSVHSIRFEEWNDSYSRICFDETVPEEKVARFLAVYFEQVLNLSALGDFDILAHLTCPLRYICGKYRRRISLKPYAEMIDAIFSSLIRREKAVEVNTSGLHGMFCHLMPSEDLLRRYYAMGGRLISLGSDAHVPTRLGNAFSEVVPLLQEIGFTGYYHYERRRPVFHDFRI